MKHTLLMVEDDLELGGTLKRQLEAHQFDVLWAKSVEEFLKIEKSPYTAAVVDLNLPDGNGFDILSKIKVPVVIMTALNTPENRLKGIENGVFDFIPKPFLFQELLIKVNRLLQTINVTIKVGGCTIDFTSRTIENKNGETVFLNDKEFSILKILIEKAPAVISRDDILNTMSEPATASHRTIDNVIVRLRQVLEDENHDVIKSVRGIGYQWIGSEKK